MAYVLRLLPKEAILEPGFWKVSPPVPFIPRLVSEQPTRISDTQELWRKALDAIPNDGAGLGYDVWFRMIAAIHHETEGSAEGLAIAQDWSARSGKHVPEFLEERVWPYLSADGRVTGGSIMSYAARECGWRGGSTSPDLSAFEMIEEDHVADNVGAIGNRSGGVGGSLGDPSGGDPRRGIPRANHLCTDQGNANRIIQSFGNHVIVCAGKWYVWTGKVWEPDEAAAYRLGFRLSSIIKGEAEAIRKKAQANTTSIQTLADAEKIAQALDKWSAKSEMKGHLDAAFNLVRKMCHFEASGLDANPRLLNCHNGTVDLSTGALKPHDPRDYITQLLPLDYDPAARCELWENIIRKVAQEENAEPILSSFLQRWYGYCATAETSAQVFVVHWGDGSNGKSTVVDTVTKVLGPYAGCAPTSMLSGKEDSPTANVTLFGKRLVTASELNDGAPLNESFVKRATGDAQLPGRYLYGQQFDFKATHKIQLLTNSKPTVKGSDKGIWRRILLVPYLATFGTQAEIDQGKATTLKVPNILHSLDTKEAAAGILTWIVQGATEWYRDGLRPPEIVTGASKEYQGEQNRVEQYTTEYCEIGPDFDDFLTAGLAGGLYPTYVEWCRDSGTHALSKVKFLTELKRIVPGLEVREGRQNVIDGRRKVRKVYGIRLLKD